MSNLRDGPNRPKVVTYWLGRVRDPRRARVTLSSEHVAFAWLGLEAACALPKGPCRNDIRQGWGVSQFLTKGREVAWIWY